MEGMNIYYNIYGEKISLLDGTVVYDTKNKIDHPRTWEDYVISIVTKIVQEKEFIRKQER